MYLDDNDGSRMIHEMGIPTTTLLMMSDYNKKYVHKLYRMNSSFIGDELIEEMVSGD